MPLWCQWWRDKLKTIIVYSNKIMMAVKAGGEHAIVSTQVIAPISPPYGAPKISKVSWLMRHYNRLEMETSWYIYNTIQIHYTRVAIIFGIESGKKNTKLPLSHTRLDTVTDWDHQLLIRKIDLVRLQIFWVVLVAGIYFLYKILSSPRGVLAGWSVRISKAG